MRENMRSQGRCWYIFNIKLKYIGQTGRTFNIRYKEYIQAIGNNNRNSGY
jgi:hypothetical protein